MSSKPTKAICSGMRTRRGTEEAWWFSHELVPKIKDVKSSNPVRSIDPVVTMIKLGDHAADAGFRSQAFAHYRRAASMLLGRTFLDACPARRLA